MSRSPPPRCLRIALVTETFPPEINGVAMTLGRMAVALRERGHTLQIVRPRQATDGGEMQESDQLLLVPGLPIPGYPGLKLGLPARRRLLGLWRRQRPDIVHIATEGPLGWSALSAARALGLPVVAGFHTNFHQYSRHYGLGWLQRAIHGYLRHFHNRARLTLVPTRALQHELQAAGYRNVEVVARGVDSGLFSPERRSEALRKAWGLDTDGLAVLYVGRLAPEKNLDLLLRAFGAIARHRPDARLVLVGDGPARAGLEAQNPHWLFCGSQTGMELATHYASANLFLFPSLTETFGNVTLEAMASGLAVVGFDHAAIAEHITSGVNGLAVPFGNESAFVEQAARLAQQPQTLSRMGQAARGTALQISWDRVFDRLEGYYPQLTGAGCSEPAPVSSR